MLTFQYHGQIHTLAEIEALVAEDILKVQTAQMVKLIKGKIEAIKPEIEAAKGTITFKLDGIGMEVSAHNLSSKLLNKIKEAIVSPV